MNLARVLGTVVATTKSPGLQSVRLLWVQPLDEHLENQGPALVAADAVQAAVGELVQITLGKEGAFALDEPFVPVDAAIVAHVDSVDL